VLGISAATIDRMLAEVRIAARGGRRRRAGFSSAVRREVPVRTFDDWNDPPPGFCEVDLVAHGGMSVTGAFIQTLTMVDVATGWTECFPLLVREGTLVVQAIQRAQTLFPWPIRGLDFDNDSAFMNAIVLPWCCNLRGLTGSQGVLVPQANVQNLMLRQDVVNPCATGQFAIYPVATIEEGLTLLTGFEAGQRGSDGNYPAGSVNRRVEDRLRSFATIRRSFGPQPEAALPRD
jgi:hypothetical protein